MTITDTANGTVTSTPSGISFGDDIGTCSATFTANQGVTLDAVPSTGYHFSGYGGDCHGYDENLPIILKN